MERGSAIVDFVLVGALVVLLFVALLQLALALHVRNVLIDSAAEGARYGALDGNHADDAVSRTEDLIVAALHPRFAQEVSAALVHGPAGDILTVTVRAPLPLVWLFGPSNVLHLEGRAINEESL